MLIIKEILKQRGLTQKDLATMIGITPIGLSKALNGNTSLHTLEKVAAALNVDISDLFGKSSTFVCPHCGKPLSIKIE